MSAILETAPGGKHRGNQDFELNIASIIDCFTVLIAFMLVSASFLSIGIFDAGVAATGNTPAAGTPPSVLVTVELLKDNVIVVKTTGKETLIQTLEPMGNLYNYGALERSLSALHTKWQDFNAVTLMASENVEYRDVIKGMEGIRKIIPVVMLGGF